VVDWLDWLDWGLLRLAGLLRLLSVARLR